MEKLNAIAGRLETLDQSDVVPADQALPLRSGASADRLMLSYLDHLHQYIAKGCSKLFFDEHYAQAVEESAKAVFQYLREASGLTLDGAALAYVEMTLNCVKCHKYVRAAHQDEK